MRTSRRLTVAGAVAALLLSHAPQAVAQSPAPAAGGPAQQLTPEQWRADLGAMMNALERTHKNWTHTSSRKTLDSAAALLSERIPGLARHQVILEMARIVALVGDGHTNIYPSRDAAVGFRGLPVSMYLFRDGLHVRRARADHAEIVGARVIEIGGVSADELYARVRPFIGRDNEMGVRFFVPHLLAMPEVLHAIGASVSTDSALFTLETDGTRVSRWLRATGAADLMGADTDRSWTRKPGWVDSRDARLARTSPRPADPLWLRVAPDTVFWWHQRLPNSRTLYAQMNQVRNGERESFAQYTAQLLATIDSTRTDRLVLDLRLNRGGNGDLLNPFVRGLLKRPVLNRPGGIVVLMGRSTWSAAQFLLNDLQEFSDAVFVGEPSGSKGNHYGDSRQTKLPNSGVTVRASLYLHQDWSPGDTRQWTAPDIAAEMSLADYRAGRDPALEAAIAYKPGVPFGSQMEQAITAGDTAGARTRVRAFRSLPAHRYADVRRLLDGVAVEFINRRQPARAAMTFAITADEYPDDLQAQVNAAALFGQAGRPIDERRAWERVLKLQPGHRDAQARLKALQGGSGA